MSKPVNTKALVASDYLIPFCPTLALCFDVSGALLLQQVHYWTSAAPNIQQGEAWHYDTSEAFAGQLKVFTAQTVRKKLKALETMGVLVVGVFNKKGYDRTRWYRIDYDKLCQIVSEKLGQEYRKISLPSGNGYRMEAVKNTAPIPKTTTKNTEVQKQANEKPFAKTQQEATPESVSGENLGGDEKQTTMEKKAMATAAEILNKVKEKPPTLTNTKAGLAFLWKKRMASLTGEFAKELTLKDKGQLGQYFVKAGNRAAEALDFALQNWSKFAWEVKAKKGLSSAPEIPVVGFVLAHYDILLQLSAKDASMTFDKPKEIAPVKQNGKPQGTPPNSEEDVVTPDEVLATLAMFNHGGDTP